MADGRRTLKSPARWRRGTSSRRAQPSYDGRLQGVANGRAIGWAWDPADAERRIEVAIEIDDEVVVSGVAEEHREELVAELGDGAHGFTLALPETLRMRSYVRLVALAGPDRQRLPRSPSFWFAASPGSVWSAVHFSYGREGDPDAIADTPAVQSPPEPVRPPLQSVAGRDGWLFDASEVIHQRPTEAELQGAITTLAATAASCAQLGVAYLPALVPDKLEALAEHAPPGTEPPDGAWRAELVARGRDFDGFDLLDLGPVLADARRHGPCWTRSDPLFNDRGAFFAARALIKEAAKRAPALGALPLSALHLSAFDGHRGSLADAPAVSASDGRPVARDAEFSGEQTWRVDASTLSAERLPVERHLVAEPTPVRLYGREDRVSPRLSLVGDEVCLALLPWVAQTAGRTSFFWAQTPPMEPIELELPDAVLHLVRLRDLAPLAAAQRATP